MGDRLAEFRQGAAEVDPSEVDIEMGAGKFF